MLTRGGIFTNPREYTPTYTSVSFRRLSNYTIKHLSNYTNVFYFLKGRLEYTLSEKIFFPPLWKTFLKFFPFWNLFWTYGFKTFQNFYMSIFEWRTFVFHVLNCLSVTTVVTICKCTKSKINMQAFCKLFLKIFFKFFCGTPCETL